MIFSYTTINIQRNPAKGKELCFVRQSVLEINESSN